VRLYADVFHDRLNVADRMGRVIDSSIGDWVIGPGAIVLDIVDFMSELMEPKKKVQIMPRLPAERDAAHQPEDHQSQFTSHYLFSPSAASRSRYAIFRSRCNTTAWLYHQNVEAPGKREFCHP